LRKTGDRLQEVNVYINLSAAASGQGNVQEALECAGKALALSMELRDRVGSAWSYFYLGYAQLSAAHFKEAERSFLQSIEIRSQISTPVLIAEVRAGLLDVYLKMGNQASVQTELEQLLEYMAIDKTFEGAEEPFRIFWAVYQALLEAKDPRATTVLQNAVQLLNTQVSKLRSEDARRMYVENVAWRRAIQNVAGEKGLLN
jgi:tetratricopeptide (TPR) repeat protein